MKQFDNWGARSKKTSATDGVILETDDNAVVSILTVGFDEAYREHLSNWLGFPGLHFVALDCVDGVWSCLSEPNLALVILDINSLVLHRDSTNVVAQLRIQYQGGIIVLAEAEDSVDRIVNLEAGADLYVPRSWSDREIISQLRAVLRGARLKASLASSALNRWVLDLRRWDVVSTDGQSLKLNAREFMMLKLLIENRGMVVSRDEICVEIFRENDVRKYGPHINNIISRSRHKLLQIDLKSENIRSVPKVGYIYNGAIRIGLSENV